MKMTKSKTLFCAIAMLMIIGIGTVEAARHGIFYVYRIYEGAYGYLSGGSISALRANDGNYMEFTGEANEQSGWSHRFTEIYFVVTNNSKADRLWVDAEFSGCGTHFVDLTIFFADRSPISYHDIPMGGEGYSIPRGAKINSIFLKAKQSRFHNHLLKVDRIVTYY